MPKSERLWMEVSIQELSEAPGVWEAVWEGASLEEDGCQSKK